MWQDTCMFGTCRDIQGSHIEKYILPLRGLWELCWHSEAAAVTGSHCVAQSECRVLGVDCRKDTARTFQTCLAKLLELQQPALVVARQKACRVRLGFLILEVRRASGPVLVNQRPGLGVGCQVSQDSTLVFWNPSCATNRFGFAASPNTPQIGVHWCFEIFSAFRARKAHTKPRSPWTL